MTVKLTYRDKKIVAALKAGAVSRPVLCKEFQVSNSQLTCAMNRLRAKIAPRRIVAIKGFGYKLMKAGRRK